MDPTQCKTYKLEFVLMCGKRDSIEITITEDCRKKLERAWIENTRIIFMGLDDDKTSIFAFDGAEVVMFTLVPYVD